MTYEAVVEMWKEFNIKDAVTLSTYLESFSVLFAYHSGKIENEQITYHDTREIFKNGKVINYTGDLKTLHEIENMKSAYKLLLRWFDEKREITQAEIKKLAAPLEDVERELEEDLGELKETVNETNVLVAAAWWHMRFEGIHAFADGNGRVGRALMNYFLMQYNHPPVIIFQEDKKVYYDALNYFDDTGEIKPMVEFLKEQLCKTWEKTYMRYHQKEDTKMTRRKSLKDYKI